MAQPPGVAGFGVGSSGGGRLPTGGGVAGQRAAAINAAKMGKPAVKAKATGNLFAAGGGTGAGTGGGGVISPGNVARPNLETLSPEAAYDPEIQKSLTDQRSYTEDLRKGTGFAMDVLTGTQKDQLEAEVIQARQAAANAGVPFDEAAFRATAQRGINSALAQEKLGREGMVGGALGAAAGTAGALAGERTDRLGLDLTRDVTQNAQKLDLYGRDIQKYSTDVNAATAANSALMDFYSKLMSGMFGMVGNLGSSMSMSNSTSYS